MVGEQDGCGLDGLWWGRSFRLSASVGSILGSEGGSQTDEDGGTEEGMAGREGGGSKVGV